MSRNSRKIAPKIFKNSAIYTLVSFLQKGIGFFLLPLYTALLTPDDYGILNVVTSLSTFLSVFILLGLTGAATRFHFIHDDESYRESMWGTTTTIVLITSVVFGGITLLFHGAIIDPIIGNIKFFPYVFIGIINTIISPLYIFYQTYLQTRQEGIKFGLNVFINFILNTGLIVFLLLFQRKGAYSVLLANVITSAVFFLYVIFAYLPKIKLGLKKQFVKPSLSYSLPLLPHLLAGASSGMLDRLFINGMRNEKETGLYSVANQFGGIIMTTANSINSAYSPWFFEKITEGESGIEKIIHIAYIFTIFYSLLALSLSLFSPEILDFMVTEKFREVWKIIPFVSFAYVFQGIYYFFIAVLFIKNTPFVFIVSFFEVVTNIVLNVVLIPKFGYLGAALACFCSFFTKSILALVIGSIKIKYIKYSWRKMYFVTIVCFLMSFINYYLISKTLFLSLCSKTIILLICFAVVWVRHRGELNQVFKFIKRK